VVGAALARRSEVVVGFDGASGRGDEDSFSLTDEHVPLWFTIQFADNQNSFNMDGNIPENSSWTSSPVPSSKKLLVTWLQQIHIRFFITSKWILSPLADEPWHHELVNPSGNCSAQRRRWTSRLGVKMVGINSDTEYRFIPTIFEMIGRLVRIGIRNDLGRIPTKFHITIFLSELFHTTIF
jgi:hypothetical protein